MRLLCSSERVCAVIHRTNETDSTGMLIVLAGMHIHFELDLKKHTHTHTRNGMNLCGNLSES